MKKLFSILTVMCLLASLVLVGTMAAAAYDEKDAPQFRVVTAKVRPFTTPDKYVNPDDYASVRAEYSLWFFKDERGEERYLFADAKTPREEITYWFPGKGPDLSQVDYNSETFWYDMVTFEIPGKTVVGLPADAECVTEWYWYGDEDPAAYRDDFKVNEKTLRYSMKDRIALQNSNEICGGALLVNPYVELGGVYDLDNDGIAEEKGWDNNGDEIAETVPMANNADAPQFRVVPAKVRPFTTPDKYVNPDDYASVRAEYVVWFFNDERGEERYLFAKAATPREEVTYWLPGKNPDYSTIDYTDEQWYPHIVFETPAKTVVGLPDDAECVTDWYLFGEREANVLGYEEVLRDSIEASIVLQNEDTEFNGLIAGARLVNPYVELGGFYDLDNDGIAEEKGWDWNGDGITEEYAEGIDPTATLVEVVPGDANGDGAVNMKDVLVLRKVLADIAVECNEANADANGDGELNMKDVLMLRKMIAES